MRIESLDRYSADPHNPSMMSRNERGAWIYAPDLPQKIEVREGWPPREIDGFSKDVQVYIAGGSKCIGFVNDAGWWRYARNVGPQQIRPGAVIAWREILW